MYCNTVFTTFALLFKTRKLVARIDTLVIVTEGKYTKLNSRSDMPRSDA